MSKGIGPLRTGLVLADAAMIANPKTVANSAPVVRTVGESTDLEFTVEGDAHARVPEGQYQVAYVSHSKCGYRGNRKLYIWFKIIDGQYLGTKIFRPYNFYEPLKRGSELFKDLRKLRGKDAPRGCKLPLNLFMAKALTVKIRTVKRDCRQMPIPEDQQYSVVDQILSVDTGRCT